MLCGFDRAAAGKTSRVEREVQDEPQVVEGEDEIPHQPADRDSYATGPATDRVARLGLWIALTLFVGVLAIVIYAIAT
jgi:hypothetical protein